MCVHLCMFVHAGILIYLSIRRRAYSYCPPPPDTNHTNHTHTSTGEDIYGRPTGAAAAGGEGGKYVPPHLRRLKQQQEEQQGAGAGAGPGREEDDDTQSEEYQRLRKLVNGLANRLSETNLAPCIRDARALYGPHSSQRVNALLTDTMLRLCVSPAQLMKGLTPAYAALVAGCHLSGSGGVGAFALERVCREYDARRGALAAAAPGSDAEEGVAKEAGNLVLIIAHLYAFGVVACGLVYGLVRELVQGMGERDVELLLSLLRAAGAQMRADDPAALKDIVLAVQVRGWGACGHGVVWIYGCMHVCMYYRARACILTFCLRYTHTHTSPSSGARRAGRAGEPRGDGERARAAHAGHDQRPQEQQAAAGAGM